MIIDKYNVMDAKRQCQKTVEIAKAQPWGKDLPWGDMFIAGGFIASHLQRQAPKDIDFYCESEDSVAKVTEHLLKFPQYIKEVDEKYRDFLGKNGKMITEWSITMTFGHSFITKHWGEPKELKKSFDYLHCCAHYELATDQLFISEATYLAATKKILEVNNPDTFTNLREQKYLKRGYTLGQSCKDIAVKMTTTQVPAPAFDPYS